MTGDRPNRYLQQIPLPGLADARQGYRGPAVSKLVGISYRQLDYWTTTGLVRASVRDRGLSLRDVTLVSDGATVYALDDSRQLIDLLQRGQGVFAIAVQPVLDQTEADVTSLPSERVAPLAGDAEPESGSPALTDPASDGSPATGTDA